MGRTNGNGATQHGKAALITGSSSGIGRATALALAKRSKELGLTVWASARRPETLGELERAGCRTIALDVTSEESMSSAVQTIEREHGAISVLVNNAGYSQCGAIEAVPPSRVRAQLETNFFGLARMIQLVLPKMREQRWGRIINVSSMGGKLVFPGFGYYHASKYAVEALSDALRFEVRGFGIGVVVIEPGFIKSGFVEAAINALELDPCGGAYEKFHEVMQASTKDAYVKGPLSYLTGTPEDVARTIERAITTKRPRARYTVAPSASLLITQRAWLGDAGWDPPLLVPVPRSLIAAHAGPGVIHGGAGRGRESGLREPQSWSVPLAPGILRAAWRAPWFFAPSFPVSGRARSRPPSRSVARSC